MSGSLVHEHARPVPGAPRAYHFPGFERHVLDNGLTILVAPVHKLPIVTIAAQIDAGAVHDARGREGTAQLTARLATEGTTRSDGAELAERLELLGASLDLSADWDGATASLTVLSTRFGDATAMLAEVLQSPSFPTRELERLRGERIAEILHQRSEPRGLADEMFARFTYASHARYAQPEDGSEASVRALAHDDVTGFHAARYHPGATTLVVAGNVRVEDTIRTLASHFGAWIARGRTAHGAVDTPTDAPRTVRVVHKPDAPQSEIRVGHAAVPRSHRDYFPLVVMNAVLGGLFNSRINLNLREAHAYTYGAFSSIDWRRDAGPFEVSTAVQSDVTAPALREILVEIDRIRADGITDDELSLATSYLDGVFPIRYETTHAIATALSALVRFGLPAEYYDTYRSHIRAAQAADVLRVAREHLRPERLQVVIVGDAEAIRAPLEAIGMGAVALYNGEGHPLAG
jgi:zinc protease